MSNETKAVQVMQPQAVERPQIEFSEEQIAILRGTIAQGATNEELNFFLQVCKRTNLDPFRKEIHFTKVWSSQEGRKVLVTIVGIDGFRGMAETTGEYIGQRGPWWCGEDEVWKEVWLGKDAPHAAKIQILRKSFPEPITAVATFQSYCQRDKDGKPKGLWKTMGDNQLAKCCEAQGFRRAFPRKFSGLYIPEEMDQANNDVPSEVVQQEMATSVLTSSGSRVPDEVVQRIRDAAHKVNVEQAIANKHIAALSSKWDSLDKDGREKAEEEILKPWRDRWYEMKKQSKAKSSARRMAGAPKPEAETPAETPEPQTPTQFAAERRIPAPVPEHILAANPYLTMVDGVDPADYGAASKAVATHGGESRSADDFVDSLDPEVAETQAFLGREPGDEPPEEFEEEPF